MTSTASDDIDSTSCIYGLCGISPSILAYACRYMHFTNAMSSSSERKESQVDLQKRGMEISVEARGDAW